MRSFLKQIFFVTLPTLLVLAIVCEIVFRTIVPASMRPEAFFDGSDSMWKLGSELGDEGLSTFGAFAQQRAAWRINNEGWNSPVDYQTTKQRPRIAIIGDSYIEAMQVDVGESYPALLGESLAPDWEVYAFGISGAPLSHYLHMARYVVGKFDPDVLVVNVVHNDFEGSLVSRDPYGVQFLRLAKKDGRIVEVAPRPNPASSQFSFSRKLLKRSAIARYVYHNLQLRPALRRVRDWWADDAPKRYSANVDIDAAKEVVNEIEQAVDYVLRTMKLEFPELRIVFVMDAPRPEIYDLLRTGQLSFLSRLLDEAATRYGHEFINLSQPMQREFAATQARFESRWDGHWDKHGHRFVADQLLPLFEPSVTTNLTVE